MTTESDKETGLVKEGPSSSKRCKVGGAGGDESHADNLRVRKVDERIFTYVSDLVPFSFAKFGLLQLGPLCNASQSCSFAEANCHVKTVVNENDLALILEFNQLFSKGIQLLSDLNGSKRDLEEHELAAIKILDDFIKEKGKNSCLTQLFKQFLMLQRSPGFNRRWPDSSVGRASD